MPRDEKREQAIELLAYGDLSYTDIATEVGISQVTLRKWRKEQDFTDEVLNRTKAILVERIPSVYSKLNKKVHADDLGAMRLMLERFDKAVEDVQAAQATGITFTWNRPSKE